MPGLPEVPDTLGWRIAEKFLKWGPAAGLAIWLFLWFAVPEFR